MMLENAIEQASNTVTEFRLSLVNTAPTVGEAINLLTEHELKHWLARFLFACNAVAQARL